MNRLARFRRDYKAVLDQMEVINAAAAADEENDGRLTEEQETEYAALRERATTLQTAIDRERELEDAERTAPAIKSVPGNGSGGDAPIADIRQRADQDPRRGFANPREFLLSVMENAGVVSRAEVSDDRLRPLALVDDDRKARGELAYLLPRAFNPSFLAAAGSDEQGGYADPYGGFATRTQFLPGMLQIGMEGDPTAGRTQPVPMSAPTVEILARTDKDHSSSVSGGFTVTRKPETVAGTASRGEMEKVSLKASTLFGLAYATEEILMDSAISFVAIIEAGFRDQFAHNMLREKIRGLGSSEYQGVIGADCAISVSRDTASRVLGTDVISMRSRCWGYNRPSTIWLANHDVMPQLLRLGAAAYDAEAATPLSGAGVLYQPSLREDRPDMMLGRPIFYTEYASTLGSAGDVILGDWAEYLDGLYQPLQSAESMHVRFSNHERAFKFWLRNAGAPWWRVALTPNQSSTTLSPFVILS